VQLCGILDFTDRLSEPASGTILCCFPGALLDGANGKETVWAALAYQFDKTLTNQGLGVSPIVGAAFHL
jgi:hypothetical protein